VGSNNECIYTCLRVFGDPYTIYEFRLLDFDVVHYTVHGTWRLNPEEGTRKVNALLLSMWLTLKLFAIAVSAASNEKN
jgi:hypothetical protein